VVNIVQDILGLNSANYAKNTTVCNLKLGGGEPCAGHVRAKLCTAERAGWSPLVSLENLGAELPTGSTR
jgi:hypothetical protein